LQANFSYLAASPDGLASIKWRSSRLVPSRGIHAKVAVSGPAGIRPDLRLLCELLDQQHLSGCNVQDASFNRCLDQTGSVLGFCPIMFFVSANSSAAAWLGCHNHGNTCKQERHFIMFVAQGNTAK